MNSVFNKEMDCKEAEEFLVKKALTQAEANKILECKHCEAPFRGRVLRNLDFNGKDLQNKNFAGTFMENINFQNSDCRGVNFYSTMMINIDFSNANLRNSIFSNTQISHSNFKSIKAPLWKKAYLFIKKYIIIHNKPIKLTHLSWASFSRIIV